jgi:hypothetical protein
MRSVVISLSMALAIAALAPVAANARSVKQPLRATGIEASAQGVAAASIHAKANRGKLHVSARGLKPGTTFGIRVGGVRIGSLTTNAGGSGTARFSSSPHGTTQFLGVDPSGHLLEVSDDQGEDVMEGDMPDDSQGQGDIQCCVPDGECEETTATDCTAANGTNMGAGSCFPSPCPTTPPSGDIVCCVPNAGQGDCNEESAADCADEGGVNVGAVACDPDPCVTTVPGMIRCCVPEDDNTQGNGNQQGECEQLTATDCTNEGGISVGPGSCDPDPCPASPSGAFLN